MAHTAMTMTAHGVDEKCFGCFREFQRGERMNAVFYEDGESAGWHCDNCVMAWKQDGEDKLPRWEEVK